MGCASPEAMTQWSPTSVPKTSGRSASLHLHNDFGLVLANAIAGIKAGAKAVTTTVSGIGGERAANLPLEQFVPAMKFIYSCDLGIDCSKMTLLPTSASHTLASPMNQPLVGPERISTNWYPCRRHTGMSATYEEHPARGGREQAPHSHGEVHTGINYVRKRVDELGKKATREQLKTTSFLK